MHTQSHTHEHMHSKLLNVVTSLSTLSNAVFKADPLINHYQNHKNIKKILLIITIIENRKQVSEFWAIFHLKTESKNVLYN